MSVDLVSFVYMDGQYDWMPKSLQNGKMFRCPRRLQTGWNLFMQACHINTTFF